MAEVEAKFCLLPSRVALIADTLTSKYGPAQANLDQSDTYFNTPEGVSVRIRNEQDMVSGSHQAFLTVKTVVKQAGGIRAVEELEPMIDPNDVDRWIRLIEQLMGWTTDIVVRKSRREWKVNAGGVQGKIMVDYVHMLGHFCEVEILSEDIKAAKEGVATLINAFGLSDLEPATGSYRYLLNQKIAEINS